MTDTCLGFKSPTAKEGAIGGSDDSNETDMHGSAEFKGKPLKRKSSPLYKGKASLKKASGCASPTMKGAGVGGSGKSKEADIHGSDESKGKPLKKKSSPLSKGQSSLKKTKKLTIEGSSRVGKEKLKCVSN